MVWKQDSWGRRLPGRLVPTFEEPFEFNPHVLHATQPWSGERWCLTLYTTRHATQVDQDVWQALRRLKFPLRRSTDFSATEKSRALATATRSSACRLDEAF